MDTARRAYRPQAETSGTAGRRDFCTSRPSRKTVLPCSNIGLSPRTVHRCMAESYPYRRSMPKLQMSIPRGSYEQHPEGISMVWESANVRSSIGSRSQSPTTSCPQNSEED